MKGGKSNLIAMSLYLPSYGVTLPVIWSFLLPSALPLALKKTRKCLAFHVQDFLPALSLLTTIYFNAFLLRRLFSQLSSFLFTPSNFSKYAAIFIYYPFFVCIWRGQRENSFIPFVMPKLAALDGG